MLGHRYYFLFFSQQLEFYFYVCDCYLTLRLLYSSPHSSLSILLAFPLTVPVLMCPYEMSWMHELLQFIWAYLGGKNYMWALCLELGIRQRRKQTKSRPSVYLYCHNDTVTALARLSHIWPTGEPATLSTRRAHHEALRVRDLWRYYQEWAN